MRAADHRAVRAGMDGPMYYDGQRNGKLDFLLGQRNDYAWHANDSDNPAHRAYSRGYRDGWNEAEEAKRCS